MLRLLILGMVLLGTVGCVTGMGGGAASERIEMTGLEDMSVDYIKTKWGEPETNVTKGEGRVVHFKKIRSQDEDSISRNIFRKFTEYQRPC